MLPFPGGISATQNGLLIFSALAALLYLFTLKEPATVKRAVVKTMSIALLAILAFVANGPTVLIVALVLASLGDYLLAFDGERAFQSGLSSFLLAQIALIVLFLIQYSNIPMMWMEEPWRIALALLVVAHTVQMAWVLWKKLPREMGVPIVAYGAIITLMALSALTYGSVTVVAGVALFYLSDTLIAYERFLIEGEVNSHPVISPAIWVTYYVAQTLITLGVILYSV